MTEAPGIYAITHLRTGRVYVGSASNISKRWSAHRKALRLGRHLNPHLQLAWTKYGECAFSFSIIEVTDNLTAREQFWIDELQAVAEGFNICPIARSSRGVKRGPMRAETKERISAAQRGVPRPYVRFLKGTKKLTFAQAEEIRNAFGGQLRKQGLKQQPSLADIGRLYGISAAQVCALLKGKTYRKENDPNGNS